MTRGRKRKQLQRRDVRQDVCWALLLKGSLLFALYLLCFGPAHRTPIDASMTANALLGTNPSEVHR